VTQPLSRPAHQQGDLTLADLSSATGISVRTLLRLESGNADRTSSYCCRLRVQQVLGEHDLLLQGGEAVEFDTRVPQSRP